MSFDDAFLEAVDYIRSVECPPSGSCFVNNPNDPGGATNYGITQAAYDRWRQGQGKAVQSVEAITQEEVRWICYQDYWKFYRCDEMPSPWNVLHFDGVFNMRPDKAGIILQKAVGATQDGEVGPLTIAATRRRIQGERARHAVQEYLWERVVFYTELVRHNKKLLEFLPIWCWRMGKLRDHVEWAILPPGVSSRRLTGPPR